MPLYEVNTISVFRHKYIIESDNPMIAKEVAKDYSTSELSQRFLSEDILTCQEITYEDFDNLVEELAKDDREVTHINLGKDAIVKAKKN
mgnify:CR=1 FL=1